MSDDNVQIGCVESSHGRKEIRRTSLQVSVTAKGLNSHKTVRKSTSAFREQPTTQPRYGLGHLITPDDHQPRGRCVVSAEHSRGRLSRIVLSRVCCGNFDGAKQRAGGQQRIAHPPV